MIPVLRACLCLLLCSLIPASLSGEDLLDYLQAYEGRWTGDYSLHSTATGYTESFTVTQRYRWEGDVLCGAADYRRPKGMVKARSRTWLDGDKLIAEVKRGEQTEVFYGLYHERGLLWLPAKMERANDYQIREMLVTKEGRRTMIIEGFDTYVYAGGLAHIVIKGELVRQADAAAPE